MSRINELLQAGIVLFLLCLCLVSAVMLAAMIAGYAYVGGLTANVILMLGMWIGPSIFFAAISFLIYVKHSS